MARPKRRDKFGRMSSEEQVECLLIELEGDTSLLTECIAETTTCDPAWFDQIREIRARLEEILSRQPGSADEPVVDADERHGDGDDLPALCKAVGADPPGDDLHLAFLAAPGLFLHVEHAEAARHLIPKVVAELQRHRKALETLVAKSLPRKRQVSYADIRAAAEGFYPSRLSWMDLMTGCNVSTGRPSDPTDRRIVTVGTYLDALLREHEWFLALVVNLLKGLARSASTDVPAGAPPIPEPTSGPARRDGLAEAGRDVQAVLSARGHRAPLLATVDVLEGAGWDLGPGTPSAKRDRLKTRIRRLR